MSGRSLDRRGLLAALAAMAALPVTAHAQRRSGRAIVIGAGLAGLACAHDIRHSGMEVTVLEARAVVGGRVRTSRLWSDHPVELGASWVHGLTGNPAARIARSAGLELMPTDYDNRAIYRAGSGLLERRALNRFEAMEERLERFAENAPGDGLARQCRSQPQGTLNNRLTRLMNLEAESEAKRRRGQLAITSLIEHEYAADYGELSRCFWTEGDDLAGGDAWVAGGFDRIADALAAGLDIRFNQRVTEVSTSGGHVVVTTTEGSERADVVVVTVPLGVLQAGAIRFTPGLPASKTLAIESLGSGLLNKCVLRFDHARWPAGIEIFNRLSADSGQWAEWVNMAAYGAGPVLMGFNAGSFARQLERASDAETGQLAMEALRSMFGSRMPEHTGVQITRWASNEHALGSYSFPCAATRWDTRIRLAEPVDNRIFFAGEATSTNAPGSVHGAIRSGRAAAVAVVER